MRQLSFGLDVMSRRVKSVLLVAAVLAASLSIAQAFPQEGQPASATPGSQSYTLDGLVINALTGKPLSGAKAQTTGRSPVTAWSGPDGKFHFENIISAQVGLPQVLGSATYDAANELTQWDATNLSYDANGNLTSDGVNTYTWNARDQLVSIAASGGERLRASNMTPSGGEFRIVSATGCSMMA